MNTLTRRSAWLLVLGWIAAVLPVPGRAQALLDDVTTLSRAATTVERSFTIATAGSYQVTLSDFAQPAAFASLRLAVTRGQLIVATLDAAGSRTFTAVAGSHEVHVIGTPGVGQSAGIFGVTVTASGGTTPLFELADTITLPPPPPDNIATLEPQFSITAAGNYQIEVTDRAFPAALASVELNILGPAGLVFPISPNAPGTYDFTAAPGDYQLLLIAEAAAGSSAGLFSVRISGGPASAVLYDRTHTSVTISAPSALALPVTGGYGFELVDFASPAAFSQTAAVLLRGAEELARRTTADVAFTASAGPAELFVFATPAATTGSG